MRHSESTAVGAPSLGRGAPAVAGALVLEYLLLSIIEYMDMGDEAYELAYESGVLDL